METPPETFQDIDQIAESIRRLENCHESRRATSVTWDPQPMIPKKGKYRA